MNQEKRCDKCGEIKLLSAFNRRGKASDGHANSCADCKNEARRIPCSICNTPTRSIYGVCPTCRRATLEERFWRRVIKGDPDDCWEWQGDLSASGYGVLVSMHKRKITRHRAHRVSYEIHYGPIPEGKEICHKCDNRKCVNPNHLFAGTHRENMLDALDKGRLVNPRPARGEHNGQSRLTTKDVLAIRLRYKETNISQCELARQYGVAHSTIGEIVRGQRWRHI